MGHVGNKLLAGFINFYLFLNVLLQLVIGCLKLTDGILKPFRQCIHAVAQNSNLILRIPCVARLKIQLRHSGGQRCKGTYGRYHLFGCIVHEGASQHKGRKSHISQELIGYAHAVMNAGQGHRHDKHGSVIVKKTPALEVIAL